MSKRADTAHRSDGALEVVFDSTASRSLLLHPEVPVELPARNGRRRFAFVRMGLAVVAISVLAVAPASSLAEGAAADAPPVITAECQITSALPDGTPSGVLPDGDVCVLPAAAAPPDPSGEPTAADGAAPAPAASEPPSADPPAAGDQPPVAAAPPAVAVTPAAPAVKPALGARSPVSTTSDERKHPDGQAHQRERSRAHARAKARSRRHARDRASDAAPGVLDGAPQSGAVTSPFYVTDEAVIPRFLIGLYKQAGHRYDVPWPILAAINEIETDFGRNVAVSSAGAQGWMQFMPATWRTYGLDADHNGVKDPNDPRDAIFSAARYLQAGGARHDMRRAIFAYNHAGWYVDSVLLRAERIAAQEGDSNRRLGRLVRAGERRLVHEVLTDSRINLYSCGREDIAARHIDRRVLIVLRFLAGSGLHPTVTSLECGHGRYTSTGNVSAHSTGDAVDIAAVNGIPILGHQGPGSVTDATIRELLTLRGATKPAQIISLMSFVGADNTLAMSDHDDHIHVGFRPLRP